MSWESEIDELRRRIELARQMGGDAKVAKQHAAGRLTVRERIERLVDPGSFHELGALAGRGGYDEGGALTEFTPTNLVMGRARIDGRPTVISGDDFTVRGGAADASIWQKQAMAEQMARELRLPIVRLLDGTGGGGSVKTLEIEGRTYVPEMPGWEHVVANLATVPVVALGLGPVAGLGAARLVSSHFSVMVRDVAQVFVAGPPVVARAGRRVEKEELGGAEIHGRNGTVDAVVETEDAAFGLAKRFLGYLPSSGYDLPARIPPDDDPDRREDWLISAIPRDRRRGYQSRPIIEAIADRGSFLELGAGWGRSAVTGLARLDGWPVAILAGDPHHYGGGWTADAAHKVVRFVDLADTFHLPVVHLVDQPGFVIGRHAEEESTIRHGARALAAIYQARVPWCSVILRRAFGVAGAAHLNASRFKWRFAWPSGDWGSLPIEGGVEAAYKAQIEAAPDPDAERRRIEALLDQVRSPFRTAEAFLIEEIVDPRDTRRLVVEFANLAAPLREPGPSRWGYRP